MSWLFCRNIVGIFLQNLATNQRVGTKSIEFGFFFSDHLQFEEMSL